MHDRVALSAIRKTPAIGAARIGIGGPVGSGKTALIERLIPILIGRGVDLAVVTNDLVTKEDAERLRRSGLIDPARVSAVEAGACPCKRAHQVFDWADGDRVISTNTVLHFSNLSLCRR